MVELGRVALPQLASRELKESGNLGKPLLRPLQPPGPQVGNELGDHGVQLATTACTSATTEEQRMISASFAPSHFPMSTLSSSTLHQGSLAVWFPALQHLHRKG